MTSSNADESDRAFEQQLATHFAKLSPDEKSGLLKDDCGIKRQSLSATETLSNAMQLVAKLSAAEPFADEHILVAASIAFYSAVHAKDEFVRDRFVQKAVEVAKILDKTSSERLLKAWEAIDLETCSEIKAACGPVILPSPWRVIRNISIASVSALALFAAISIFPFPEDSTNDAPQEFISPRSDNPRIKSLQQGLKLRAGESYDFRGEHPRPLKQQWLIHIDGRVRVVASSSSGSPIEYGWTENRFSRDFDCFFIVTSDQDLFPTKNWHLPEFANELFSAEDIRTFITSTTGGNDAGVPETKVLKRARVDLTNAFGHSHFRLQLMRVPYED